ncbi:MAG: OmpA family protein [Prevotella sp.]|nr:OmpA family protein [Prevotella sp.]
MKKLVLMFFAAALTMSVSAQALMESKLLDNMYIGVNGGVAVKTTQHTNWMGNLNPNLGVRIGKDFTPVFGFAIESNVYFSNKPGESIGTVVRSMNTMGLATLNLSNLFGGYKGEPRLFEVTAIYGLGWGHTFGHSGSGVTSSREEFSGNSLVTRDNTLTSKAAIDFGFNIGSKKAWQVYIEPAMIWTLGNSPVKTNVNYDINYSGFQANVGFIYKFKTSNGTHNFKYADLRDQGEIDALNAKINDLRGDLDGKDAQLAAKDRQIADLQAALDECNNRPVPEPVVQNTTVTNLQPTVLFRQGKSVVDQAQYAPIELIATYMKNHPEANIEIKGYASPEGSAELNQKLSEDRAEAVKKILVNKYKISSDRLTTKGCGATDELFEQVEFNRVATFNDNSK